MPQHKGKEFQVIRPIGSNLWTWIVHLDEETTRAGKSLMKYSAVQNAMDCINYALAKQGAK